MWHKYRNEMILAISVVLFVLAVIFRYSAISSYSSQKEEIRQSIAQIEETAKLQKLWKAKRMKSRLNSIRSILSGSLIKQYKISRNKVEIKATSIDGKSLNRFMNKLASLPIQFNRLSISREGDNYSLECLCKW